MAARKPLSAGLQRPIPPADTPTHIAAILNRIGKLERAQRAAVPDQLLRRLDALGEIVANLQESHGQLAEYLHQELVEIREALPDSRPTLRIDFDLATALSAVDQMDIPTEPRAWPVGNHGAEIDVDALAQEVHDLRLSDPDGFAQLGAGPVTPADIAYAKKRWPEVVFLGPADQEQFARDVRANRPRDSGSVPPPLDSLPARPNWFRRWF